MAKELFIDRNFAPTSLTIIEQANEIITAYRAQGFTLTLRQLYYQFVSRDLLPNKQTEYKRLGSIINDARLAGLIDWSAIEDRTRNVRTHPSWETPADIIESAASGYAEDLWEGQEYRPEVWIEKDALLGVIEPVCSRYRIPYFACRGYTSQSEQYRAGKRFARHIDAGLTPLVIHLGDHDPSGIDMTRDNFDRLTMFSRSEVEVRRIALNMDQIRKHRPPPNPAKETDSRSSGYIAKYGNKSWELDALDPTVIDRLIAAEVQDVLDTSAWENAVAKEMKRRKFLKKASERWEEIEEMLGR